MANTLISQIPLIPAAACTVPAAPGKNPMAAGAVFPQTATPFTGNARLPSAVRKRVLSIADSVRKSPVIYSQAIPVMKKMETLPWAHA